jgi:hypothetical protein
MVEGRPRAEVVCLDERHRQPAACRVSGDGESIDAAAHDEDVEYTCGE